MEIKLETNGAEALIILKGRLDTVASPELDAVIESGLDGVTELTLDFAGVDYISSAGLRVLLSAQKKMNRQGGMTVKHVNESVMEVLELTGFAEILTIE